MKKLTAAVLAMLMLLTAAACAERAKVMTYSNPYLELTEDGERREVDLSGISLRLTGGMPEGVPTVQAELLEQGGVAQRGLMQCIDGRLYFQADGLGEVYAVELSQLGDRGQRLVDAVFEDMDYLLDFKLPVFDGVSIPRLDMTLIAPLTGATVTTDEAGRRVADIEVPYFMVRQLLTMANGYRDAVPASARVVTDPLFALLDQLVASDSGFALKGAVATGAVKSSLTLDIYPVQGGVTAEAAAARVKFVSAENQVDVTVDVYQGESTVNAAAFSITSAPGDGALSASLDVMSLVLADVRLYREGDAQVVTADVSSLGQRASVYINYGTMGNTDFFNVMLNVPNRIELRASVQANDDGDGASAGTSALDATLYGDDAPVIVGLTGDIAERYEDVDFGGIRDTEDAVDALHMTADQQGRLTGELNRLLDRFVSRYGIG